MPLRAAPSTVICLPCTSCNCSLRLYCSSLSHFKRCQTQNHQEDGDDIKSCYNFRLGPTEQLEVVMNRRHAEHAPSFTVFLFRVLKIKSLNYHRCCFHQKHTAERREKQFFLD